MCNWDCEDIGRNHAGSAAQEMPRGAVSALPQRQTNETEGVAAAEDGRESEAPEIVWVGQQHLMHGYCGRRPEAAVAPVARPDEVAPVPGAAWVPVKSADLPIPPAPPGPDAYRRFQLAAARAVRRVAARSMVAGPGRGSGGGGGGGAAETAGGMNGASGIG